jgi:gliding motility-associated protein GldM
MAGGKETPRQKMIGMMYLVLTALLALNVSKAILDAFVAIEENVQIANLNEYGRGEEKKSELNEAAHDESQPEMRKKAQKLLSVVNQIDAITAQQIRLIDGMKLEILKKSGEDVNSSGTNFIVTQKYDSADPLRPTRMNLMKVDGKDKFDEPMEVMGISDDIKKPKGNGIKLWNSYNSFRSQLTEIIVNSSSEKGKKYSFVDPKINSFKDFADIKKQLNGSLKNVSDDDKAELTKIYASLTKQEFADVHEGELKNVHWIGRTFDHSPTVAALASLSSLQKEILTARADAVSLIRSRVDNGEYSFNKIMPLAYGPEVANQNEEVEIQVLMAAFNSDKKPKVSVNGGLLKEIKDGKGIIRTKGSSGEIKLTGEITITNKRGQEKTMPWSKTIQVMRPQGTISLPDMMVLYRGYDNRLQAAASGYPDFKLTGTGVSIRKSGNEYIGTVTTSAKTATIQISGFNKMTNKSVPLGSTTFKVRSLPAPSLFWGSVESGGQVPKGENKISTRYGPDILLTANFDIVSWELIVEGSPIRVTGRGKVLDVKAIALVKQGKPGSNVILNVKTIGPDKVLRNRTGVFRL